MGPTITCPTTQEGYNLMRYTTGDAFAVFTMDQMKFAAKHDAKVDAQSAELRNCGIKCAMPGDLQDIVDRVMSCAKDNAVGKFNGNEASLVVENGKMILRTPQFDYIRNGKGIVQQIARKFLG